MADVCLQPASPTTFHSPFSKKSLASSQDFTKSPLCAKELMSDDVKASPVRRPFANITNSGPLNTDELGTSPLKRDFQIFSGSQANINLAGSHASYAGSQVAAADISSDDEIFTPRKTPKRRSVLLSRNQDVIDKYRCSIDGSEKTRFSVNAEKVMAESLAQDDEIMKEMRRELQESKEAQRSAEAKLSHQEEQLLEAQKRVELLEAEVEAVHERQVGKREAGKLRKALAQHEVLFELLCRHVDAETVLKCEAVAGIKHLTDEGDVFRHSLEVMKTLPEEEEEAGAGDISEGEVSVLAMSVLGSLKKELSNAREEAESLRQTADACWVREQAACKRIQELEEEGRELSAFTQQMAQAHSRLTAGVQELTEKQRCMVPLQALNDKERDLQDALREAEKERERAAEVEGQLEEQQMALVRSLEAERSKVKQEAWALAEGKMEEMEKAHAEAYRVLTKRIQFLQEELAESSLEGEHEEEEQAGNRSLELLYAEEEGGASWFSPRKKPRRKLGLAPRSPAAEAALARSENKLVVTTRERGRGGLEARGWVLAVLAVLVSLLVLSAWPDTPATPMPLIM